MRALRGSQEAFGELVARYERPVFSLIARMVRNAQLAEDLSQETFVKSYRALGSYDQKRKFSSWLFKIAHNTTIDYLRRRRLETEPLENPDPERASPADLIADVRARSPYAEAERLDLAQALERSISGLRREYREVMQLRFREGCSYLEIAEITGMALGTVKTNLHRARKELAGLLAAEGWDGGE